MPLEQKSTIVGYIRLEDNFYPLTESEIKSSFLSSVFSQPFSKIGYSAVYAGEVPKSTNLQTVVEDIPVLLDSGVWQQTWVVKSKFQDTSQKTKEEQEAEFLLAEQVKLKAKQTQEQNENNLLNDTVLSDLKIKSFDQIDSYINDNITTIVNIKTLLKTLTKVVMQVTKKEL
ncbi:MAG: hypothetical protein GY861_11430 [bacterium]|nr:hypothetical protein [bacterium]